MPRRIILQGTEARDELAKGAERLAKAISGTLGPYGGNWLLDKGDRITNDGVTIAREFQLEDEVQNKGAKALREAAIKTVEETGDGTTTAITLAWAIYQTCSRYLAKEGIVGQRRPTEIVQQIEQERKEITDKLISMANPIEVEEQLINSAIVAVEDKELGKLIGSTQWELGKNGYLLVEETAEKTSSIERIKGIRIDNGFGTSQIINNQEKQTLEIEDTKVLLTTHLIKTANDFTPIKKLYESLLKNGGKNLVIIARAWTDETITWCLRNIQNGAFIYPLSAPYIDMQERMKDLQAILGGTFYDFENSVITDISLLGLGQAKKVIAKRHDAILAGDDFLVQNRVEKRVIELQQKYDGSNSEFEKKSILERMAQLQNGFAILKVGASSDVERKRLFDKCEDGVHAVRAAFQEGIVKGGGLAFKEISDTLSDNYLLKRPLLSIYEQIMSSAPKDFVIEDWVKDPVKVLRIALERACAVASTFATAEGVIVFKKNSELDELFGKFKQNDIETT